MFYNERQSWIILPDPIIDHLKWGLIVEATSSFHPHHGWNYFYPFHPDLSQRPLYSLKKPWSLLGHLGINRILLCHSIQGSSIQITDSLERYPIFTTSQDFYPLSFVTHGSPFQIGRALLSLSLEQDERDQHHRGNGHADCLEGLRFLYHFSNSPVCFDWASRLFQD